MFSIMVHLITVNYHSGRVTLTIRIFIYIAGVIVDDFAVDNVSQPVVHIHSHRV